MGRAVRDGSGVLLLLSALVALAIALGQIQAHDYVAAILLVVVGLSLLRAGVELLRPGMGE